MKKGNSLPNWFKEYLKRMDRQIAELKEMNKQEKIMKSEMQKMMREHEKQLKEHRAMMRDHEGALKARWMDVQELKGKR